VTNTMRSSKSWAYRPCRDSNPCKIALLKSEERLTGGAVYVLRESCVRWALEQFKQSHNKALHRAAMERSEIAAGELGR
jgi:hypothetical protein